MNKEFKSEKKACELWILRDFSQVPTDLLERAYGPDYSDITILAPTPEDYEDLEEYYEENPKIPMWGWVFIPDDPLDAKWIRQNAKKIAEECGLIVYETPELGVYLGVNGAGYDFYEAHWLPLYRLRGLKWHTRTHTKL